MSTARSAWAARSEGGVIDGVVGWEGSTNWSGSGEGTIVAADGSDTGRKAQNNTCAFYVNPVEASQEQLEESYTKERDICGPMARGLKHSVIFEIVARAGDITKEG